MDTTQKELDAKEQALRQSNEQKKRERQKALLNDKEKLISWIERIDLELSPTPLELNNTNAIDAHRSIIARGDEFIRYARERINEL